MQGQLVGTALKVRGVLSGLDNDVTYSGRKVNVVLIKVHNSIVDRLRKRLISSLKVKCS